MAKKKPAAESGGKVISQNKKARFNYDLGERYEAGIVLTGPEIKSIRAGKVSLAESFIRPEGNELYLLQADIARYRFDASAEYDSQRKRKLLLHRREIDKLRGFVEAKGFTIVPVKLYLKHGLAKLEIAIAKGRAAPDKRKVVRERELNREAERAMKTRSGPGGR